jgi:signal transduction histidine kinase
LPIAKALIELHGGDLVLSSQPGAGTTARLRLPRNRVRSAAASSAA